ncbi:hypothetical protein A2954_02795 [Candidatus Roizmanbacteria bacterium RIFCSPLOWO2_01_FULL_37_12]|uniref:Glycosyl transferase family 1 domain-containing protein n=1 Tax=Candidatus Roizmanbacteria bacterium RIFCSPLOWO2_01_FULL_37_12 TaxID=1802056 RepID=A0A1F7IAC7_9BACT|nr:MAG: hypothetical protein A3D76_03610 [Candidatus Roizmanbacteria bacterium RIFCSPHIGHO2_02_FULL_37_9b]OGK40306.1 MAG: hypothetical protein A2954_02795 [Candidatus Roizmanbacteria bacterium RIFCSPLOWO2_01_FULL_37_12]
MKKRVVIATHVFSPGTSQAFYKYCQRKKFNAIFIQHPLFGNIFSWFWGAVDTFWQVFRQGKKYDLFFGSNRLNTAVGIMLKKAGRAKKVIYFSPDWSQKRFKNNLLNYFFQKLDYFCVKYADIVWNSSHEMKLDPMMKERLNLGYPKKWLNKQIQVSDGTDDYPIPEFSKINRYRIGFVGHLKKEMGVQLAIESLTEIKKTVPDVSLLIIGSGPYEDHLKLMAKNLPVEFTGFIGNIFDVYKILARCAIAIAPYEETNENISQFSDPGKTKNYFSVGLPIIITKVPKIADEIDYAKAGIAIHYRKQQFINAAVKLLKENNLKIYRKNVLQLKKKYGWDRIFDRALRLTNNSK